ncbi:MAG TPA: hypothetical protein VLH09_13740 [Bryobacteraceae bacterium]|nr:hypothetical protein [Bryobacteraceae bacterium]
MPAYRIHRLRETQRQQFRWAPHSGGVTSVKARDYTQGDAIQAPGEYAAWTVLRGSEDSIQVGDLLERDDGALYICKYVGFEEARWVVPEAPNG